MKRTIVLLLIAILCACGVMTPPKDKTSSKSTDSESADNSWVGHTVDELVIANGVPSNVYTLRGGGRVFEYLNFKKATTNVQPSTRPAISEAGGRRARLADQVAQPSRALAGSRAKPKDSDSDQSRDCIVLFHISASDIIESWSTKSGQCN